MHGIFSFWTSERLQKPLQIEIQKLIGLWIIVLCYSVFLYLPIFVSLPCFVPISNVWSTFSSCITQWCHTTIGNIRIKHVSEWPWLSNWYVFFLIFLYCEHFCVLRFSFLTCQTRFHRGQRHVCDQFIRPWFVLLLKMENIAKNALYIYRRLASFLDHVYCLRRHEKTIGNKKQFTIKDHPNLIHLLISNTFLFVYCFFFFWCWAISCPLWICFVVYLPNYCRKQFQK